MAMVVVLPGKNGVRGSCGEWRNIGRRTLPRGCSGIKKQHLASIIMLSLVRQ